MTGWRGVLAGFLGLAGLYALIGTAQGPGRVGGLASGFGKAARLFLDPAVTPFPSKAKKASLSIPAGPGNAPLVLDPNAPFTKTA